VNRPNRAVQRQRSRARSRPAKDSGTSPNPQSSQAPYPLTQIHITLTVPRHLGWLLTGITTGSLRLPDGLLEQASRILRALLPG